MLELQNMSTMWPHNANPCPAICRNRGKPNHFGKMCQSSHFIHGVTGHNKRNNHQVSSAPNTPDSSSDDEHFYVMSQDTNTSKTPTVSVKINGISINMVDTGGSIDILDETAYKQVNYSCQITLQPSTKRLFAYGSAAQPHVHGSFDATLAVKNNQTASTLQVLEGNHGSLLRVTQPQWIWASST